MTSVGVPDDGVALVLSGAVAKGAFGVGVVGVFAANGWPIRRIAATSSGALTAAVLGAGVATGQLEHAADVARSLWLDHGAWGDITHVSWSDWLHARGLSDTSKLVALVEEGIQRVVERAPVGGVRAPVKVTLVAGSLTALPADDEPLPRYELDRNFDASDFLDRSMWSEIATCAAASATFPGLFSPTMVDGRPCVDGGAVNNAPISCVLDDPQVQTVIVVTTEALTPPPAGEPGGADLVAKLADILINERIAHDFGQAQRTNVLLRGVVSALDSTGATAQTRAAVLGALGWRDLRLVLVCPDPALPGTALSGFADRELRRAYIEAGRVAAEKALDV